MGVHVPDPVISRADGTNPEEQALLADSVGLALNVVLETLTPPTRSALADSTWLSSTTPTASRPVGAEGQVA